LAIIGVLVWMWDTDPGPTRDPVDIGGGVVLPVYMSGPSSHSWWGTVVFLLVATAIFGCLIFAYFFLWTVNPDEWPPPGVQEPELLWPAVAAGLYAASSALIWLAGKRLAAVGRDGGRTGPGLLLAAAVLLVVTGFAAHLYGFWDTGLKPSDSGYAATVYGFIALQGQYVFALAIMGPFTLAKLAVGKLDGVRRQTFDNTMLVWHYSVGQGLIALAITLFFPALIG
jgi:cytochrome c oxidase subunit I+III